MNKLNIQSLIGSVGRVNGAIWQGVVNLTGKELATAVLTGFVAFNAWIVYGMLTSQIGFVKYYHTAEVAMQTVFS